jgi:hypothetical protein
MDALAAVNAIAPGVKAQVCSYGLLGPARGLGSAPGARGDTGLEGPT